MELSAASFSRIPFPLPPLEEQRRIVAKLEALFSKLEAGVTALQRARGLLKRYRQSLLRDAVEGKLSADWRAKQSHALEPAGALLERVLRERRAAWEARELARLRAKGMEPLGEAWKARYEEPSAPDVSSLPELPAGWVWARLEQLAWDSGYGTSEKCSYEFDGIPVLRIPNISDGRITLEDVKYAGTSEGFDHPLLPGDLLVIRTNGSRDLIGRAAIVTEPFEEPHSFASYLIRYRLLDAETMWQWIVNVWHSYPVRSWMEDKAASSAGQYNVSMGVLNNLILPIPPLEEQLFIVAELERRFELLDSLESTLESELKRAAQLRQSALHRAFTGRLVPQDPTDEPASVLLERIRTERSNATPKARAAKLAQPAALTDAPKAARGRPRKAQKQEELF